jgi:hypothetical protein
VIALAMAAERAEQPPALKFPRLALSGNPGYGPFMAQCFCGCGRKVGLFPAGVRSANGVGQRVSDALDGIEQDVRPYLTGAEQDNAFVMHVDKQVREGEEFEAQCCEVVHGGIEFADVMWPVVRQWVRDAQGMVGFARQSPARQQRIMDRS